MNRLRLAKVSVTYHGKAGAVAALSDVTLAVEAGQFVAVIGPSGSGKSTLLLAAGALLRPTTGTVTIGNTDAYALPPAERRDLRRRDIGFVFQQFHLVPYLTVTENVLLPALTGGDPAASARAAALLDRFGLTPRRDHLPSELSVGERQRAALARALLNRPGIILADEPTGNLDEESGRIVLNDLAQAARDGCAVLVVTHDSRVTQHAQSIVRLTAGRITLQE